MMDEKIYNIFIKHLFDGCEKQIIPLGFRKNVYNDWLVIEVAAAGKIRFSFKFKKEKLECCVNLRPFSEKLGSDSAEEKENFKSWVKKNYQKDIKSEESHPYFKPFATREISKKSKSKKAITKDVFFVLGENYLAEQKQEIKTCPVFPTVSDKPIEINLKKAVALILNRL